MTTNDDCDVLVIGGGAAGLMCAIAAGRRGRRVRVLEHANRCGKKILMSGGGRCNFTNTGTTPGNFLSSNPHFCKSALARYRPEHFVALVDAHGIGWHEKELGQLFCDDSSKRIVAMLLDECRRAGVRIDTATAVADVGTPDGGGFRVRTTPSHEGGSRGVGVAATIAAASLVVATGGLSIPSLGATGFGYALARRFGHTVLPTRAGLVPLTLSGKTLEQFADLAGVSLHVSARCGKARFDNAMLFTHRGLSGPAILQISNYWRPRTADAADASGGGHDLWFDLLPEHDAETWLLQRQAAQPDAHLATVLADVFPKRFAQRLCDAWFGNRPLRQYTHRQLPDIAARLAHWPVVPSGTEGYRTAEVTLGGVDTREVSSATMESQRQPGLYFVGEVLDVTGWLGGYNFQWAWASGHAAGKAA
jgi:predicted Rossmann fold flavoprotein